MANGATVGSAVIKLEFDGKDVKASLSSIQKDVESSGKKTGSAWASAWTVAAGAIIAKGVSKIASVISSNLGGAISRVDVLNNFPNVMSNLGISSEEASSAIEKISDKLQGLPTTLDAGAAAVQRFTSKNNDVQKSTDIFLALNNAILAGGAPTETQATALEQLSQAYAKGKPDMMEWRSAMTAMPAQLNQVAQAMGFGANGADALGEALRNGDVSMDDFMAQIARLNTEGVDGFLSFEEQAKNSTGGIQTQLTNLSTSIKKVLADGLNGKDMTKSMEQLFSRLKAVIQKLGPGLANILKGVISGIVNNIGPMITEMVPGIVQGITELVQVIADSAPQFIQGVIDIISSMALALADNMPTILNALTNGIIQMALVLTQPENLTKMAQGFVKLMTSFLQAMPQIITAIINALPQIIENVIGWLTNPETIGMMIQAATQLWFGMVLAVPQILGALLGAFGQLVGDLWNWITSRFGQFASDFGNFIGGIFKGAINGVLAFIENFINGPIDLLNGFLDIINGAFEWLGVHIDHIGRINLPRLAEGGYAGAGATTAIIGEAGKEVVLPLENNTDNWAGLLAATLSEQFETQGISGGREIVVNMTNEINNEMDAQDIGRVLMESIRRAA